jgi:hypothetical protein
MNPSPTTNKVVPATSSLLPLFEKLGNDIEDAWAKQNYDEAIFPSLAAAALKEAGIPAKMSAWDVVKWTLEETELPRQRDLPARFGQPPITLYNAPRFYIDVYFWLEGTTATHQHSFCGAFQVFQGSSIHSWYEFELKEKINSFVEIGEMSLRSCELLELGDVQEIQPGRQYIHSLFHLDQPSVTIVVRTDKSPLGLPQFSYFKPSLAVDPFYEHETTTKKLQTIGAIYRSKLPEADQMVIDLIDRSDLQTAYMVLSTANSWLRSDQIGQAFNAAAPQERFENMLQAAKKRHGKYVQVLREVFARTARESDIIRRRSFITNAEHRFFLALLLNIDDRDAILSVIRQRFPEADPIEKILDWTFDLSETRIFGVNEANALGIPDFDNLDMIVFEGLIKDQNEAEIRAGIKNEANAASQEIIAQIPDRIAKLKNAAIFKPLVG